MLGFYTPEQRKLQQDFVVQRLAASDTKTIITAEFPEDHAAFVA